MRCSMGCRQASSKLAATASRRLSGGCTRNSAPGASASCHFLRAAPRAVSWAAAAALRARALAGSEPARRGDGSGGVPQAHLHHFLQHALLLLRHWRARPLHSHPAPGETGRGSEAALSACPSMLRSSDRRPGYEPQRVRATLHAPPGRQARSPSPSPPCFEGRANTAAALSPSDLPSNSKGHRGEAGSGPAARLGPRSVMRRDAAVVEGPIGAATICKAGAGLH